MNTSVTNKTKSYYEYFEEKEVLLYNRSFATYKNFLISYTKITITSVVFKVITHVQYVNMVIIQQLEKNTMQRF